jgi:hypothetical protein
MLELKKRESDQDFCRFALFADVAAWQITNTSVDDPAMTG